MQQLTIDDITANYHKGNHSSVLANEIVKPKKEALRKLIYDYITSQGKRGATCYEVELALNIKHQTASARLSEMRRSDSDLHVFWNGLRRSTGAATAQVYVTSKGQVA